MKVRDFLNTPPVLLQLDASALKARRGDAHWELALERGENGRLTAACRERLQQGLRDFVKRDGWQPGGRAFCAIGARGVSMRRLSLPPSSKDELPRLVALQIESEFPLPPEELAWGFQALPQAGAGHDVIVAAVRKDALAEFADIFTACGLQARFTLAALARSALASGFSGAGALLDLAPGHSELLAVEHSMPVSLRVLPYGLNKLDENPAALDSLAAAVGGLRAGQKLLLSGEGAGISPDLAAQLGARLGPGVACEWLAPPAGGEQSATLAGLQRAVEQTGGRLALELQVEATDRRAEAIQPAPRKWALLAAALLLGVFCLPYAEALVMKPILARRLAALKSGQGRLAQIDGQFAFLQTLKKSQPPYLDALAVLSKASPGGVRLESIAMNRRGEVSVRGKFRLGQQVDFRTKLLDSGFFSSVVMEEQTPTPDRQNVTVRITAQWKAAESRRPVEEEPPRTNAPPALSKPPAGAAVTTNATAGTNAPAGTNAVGPAATNPPPATAGTAAPEPASKD